MVFWARIARLQTKAPVGGTERQQPTAAAYNAMLGLLAKGASIQRATPAMEGGTQPRSDPARAAKLVLRAVTVNCLMQRYVQIVVLSKKTVRAFANLDLTLLRSASRAARASYPAAPLRSPATAALRTEPTLHSPSAICLLALLMVSQLPRAAAKSADATLTFMETGVNVSSALIRSTAKTVQKQTPTFCTHL